jgi:hypothetical protein
MKEERLVLCEVSFEQKTIYVIQQKLRHGEKKGTSIFWLVFSLYSMLWFVENPVWRLVFLSSLFSCWELE